MLNSSIFNILNTKLFIKSYHLRSLNSALRTHVNILKGKKNNTEAPFIKEKWVNKVSVKIEWFTFYVKNEIKYW